jgi:hypothetical protein
MDTTTKLALLRLCAVLHTPAADELGLAAVAPLRAELIAKVGRPLQRAQAPEGARSRRFWLEAELYDSTGELDRAGLTHLDALRNEMDPLVRPGETARVKTAERIAAPLRQRELPL